MSWSKLRHAGTFIVSFSMMSFPRRLLAMSDAHATAKMCITKVILAVVINSHGAITTPHADKLPILSPQAAIARDDNTATILLPRCMRDGDYIFWRRQANAYQDGLSPSRDAADFYMTCLRDGQIFRRLAITPRGV